MAIWWIENKLPREVLFTKFENTQEHYLVEGGGKKTDIQVWTPWVDNKADWARKTIVVIDVASAAVLGYVWEHGGQLKTEKSGYSAEAKNLSGTSDGDIGLIVTANGTLEGQAA